MWPIFKATIYRTFVAYVYQIIELIERFSSYFGLASDKRNLEDTFYQLLHDKNYDEASKLAEQYRYLDIDLVYKCKWRNIGITVNSINNVLGKIQDKLWAINECVQTVPISHEACRKLLEFGLQEADLRLLYELGSNKSRDDSLVGTRRSKKHDFKQKYETIEDEIDDRTILEIIDFAQLNDQQKELCRCRQNLIRFMHYLQAYESTLGDYQTLNQNFDHVFYDEFRRMCPLNICINFAHDGDANAVEICLDFFTEDLKDHLLAILSHFPETLSPYQYRNLLPCSRESDRVFERRSLSGSKVTPQKSDWSYRDRTSLISLSFIEKREYFERDFYEITNPQLKKYLSPFTDKLLTQWFIERSLEIEDRTLLLSTAIQLLHLGMQLKIKNLKNLHDDLIEFDRIVYDCCTEDNIYLSLNDFKKMSEQEKLILMTGNSVKICKDRFRFYIIPYLMRRENGRSLSERSATLRGYFLRLAHTKEQFCRSIYNDLLDKIECDNVVADWTEGMDEVIDEIGEEIKKIERERQAKQISTMANQTFTLGDFDECYEACKLMMKNNFIECWEICSQLGLNQKFHNNEAKYELLAFALAHCEDSNGETSTKILDYVIELRKRDENIQLAYLSGNM